MFIYAVETISLATFLSSATDLKKILNSDENIRQNIILATKFLPLGVPFRQRLWHILNNTQETPTCSVCSHPVKWDNAARSYRTFCCSKCTHTDDNTRQKTFRTLIKKHSSIQNAYKARLTKSTETNLKRRGVRYTFQDADVRQKSVQTLIKKHGVDHNTKIDSWCERMQETNLKKYGGISPMHDPLIREKQRQTMLSRHNKPHNWCTTNDEIRSCVTTMLERYGVEHNSKIPATNLKRKKTCLEKYGADHPWKSHTIQEQIKMTHLEKWGVVNPKQKHIGADTLNNINSYDWLHEQHIIHKKTLTQIANENKVSLSMISAYTNKHSIKVQKHNQLEQQIIAFVKKHNINIIEHTRKIIPPYELDIFLPEQKIAIEINGIYWHSELNGCSRLYHLMKTNLCLEQNIRLIHIFENEWFNKRAIVESRLSSLFKHNTTIPARKCAINPNLTKKQIQYFLNNNHIQGHLSSLINIGLMYNNEIVAIMSFSKARNGSSADWELTRFANKTGTTVVGGASKCFKYFINTHKPTSIISYSDKRWNTGKLYQILGFTFSHTSTPNYWYFENNSFTLYSRVKFQKHKLSRLLEVFDPNLSEWNNMKSNGWNRIWDCGNDVWIWSANA